MKKKKLMNKKGIIFSIFFIVAFFFIMAIINVISLTAWNGFNEAFQAIDNSTITPEVKEKVDSFTNKMLWADNLFAFSYFLMMITFLITAKTASKAQPEFLIIFIAVLIVITVFCMIISNSWQFFSERPTLSTAADSLTFTGFVMSYYPIITIIFSVFGALLFYGRKDDPASFGGGGVEGFLENDSFMRGGRGDNFE